jgi:hypothetical protein
MYVDCVTYHAIQNNEIERKLKLTNIKTFFDIMKTRRYKSITGITIVRKLCQYIYSLFTQPLTEMSTRNINLIMFIGSKVRRVRKTDNLTAIYEPIV